MDNDKKELLKKDFELFIANRKKTGRNFSIPEFADFASAIINFYVGGGVLAHQERNQAALFLTSLYNKGLRNVISDEDVRNIAQAICQEELIDYNIINQIFN